MNSIFKTIIPITLAAVVAGCAARQPAQPPASNAEREAATIRYMDCLVPYAKRLDDGRSDARTIAQAMRGACKGEMETVYETISRGENDAVKIGIWRGMGSIEESSALQVVLDVRKSK